MLLLVGALFLVGVLQAQEISVSAPSNVATGENFRISYTIATQNVEEFRAANIPSGLEIIAGPYTSQQSSVQVINGHTSSYSSITYTYTLYAEKAGNYTIAGARARIGGRAASSRAIHIKVTGAARKNGGNTPNMHEDDDAMPSVQAGQRISGNDLFVKVSANKRRVHEQEPILLTYKVYTLVDLTQLDGKMPDLTGFHTQEVKLPSQKSFHIEKVNGRNYRCVTWSQYVMYPQMTGKLQIPSITFKGIVVQQNRAVDPFEAFFNGGSGYVEVKRNIVAPGLTVDVDPLPKKPVGFSGGVGRFTISAQVNHSTVKAGNPLTLRVVVGGTGNLKLMKQPSVGFPKDFDKYDPKVTDKTKLTANGIEGNMVYDFLVVPRNQGNYVIPSVSLTYFDTTAQTYKTVKTSPINVTVTKGDGKQTQVDSYSAETMNDILPLKKCKDVECRSEGGFYGSAMHLVCLLVPLGVFVILFVVFRKRAVDNADIVKMKGKRANKVATRRLRSAYKLMLSASQNEFYDEVLRALWGYISDRMNISVENLSRENIQENLASRSIDASVIEDFITAIDECEFERYAPGDTAGNMNKTYESAMKAITSIENTLASRKKKSKAKTMALVLLLLSLCPVSVSAITKENADAEYLKGNYQQAIADYQELLHKGERPELFYNLGNSYYRVGNIPQALLAYERAQRLAPGDKDVRFNLQFVQSKTIDRIIPTPDAFFVTWYRSVVMAASVDGWAKVSVLSVVVMLVLGLLFLFGPTLLVRRLSFYCACLSLLLFAASNLFAYQERQMLQTRNTAIVVSPTVTVKKTPSDNGTENFVLHEGAYVDVTDSTLKDWRGIKLPDGREGWLKTTQIENI